MDEAHKQYTRDGDLTEDQFIQVLTEGLDRMIAEVDACREHLKDYRYSYPTQRSYLLDIVIHMHGLGQAITWSTAGLRAHLTGQEWEQVLEYINQSMQEVEQHVQEYHTFSDNIKHVTLEDLINEPAAAEVVSEEGSEIQPEA